ncbi:MAG TPA: SCO family protein [Vicinamibacterales bacterium]|nr:SCO family protein [Vicinamibacterales bacterium]
MRQHTKKGVRPLFGALLLGCTALAQTRPTDSGLPAAALPPALREVGFDQHLNHMLPLETEFTDETGKPVKIGDYFGKRPVVLAFVYYGCPMLCLQSLASLASTLGVMSQDPGKDFEVVSVSIDPRETPAMAFEKKAHYVERSGRPTIGPGWHYLTGTDTNIRRLTNAAGFRYIWDVRTQQYAHPAGIVIATPQGRVSRYLFGIDYGPRDLQLAVLDASGEKIGSIFTKALLYCYHYDLSTGRYSLAIMRIVQVTGAATVLLLGALIFAWTRSERKQVG